MSKESDPSQINSIDDNSQRDQ